MCSAKNLPRTTSPDSNSKLVHLGAQRSILHQHLGLFADLHSSLVVAYLAVDTAYPVEEVRSTRLVVAHIGLALHIVAIDLYLLATVLDLVVVAIDFDMGQRRSAAWPEGVVEDSQVVVLKED